MRVRADDPWHAELLPELLELGCEPPFVTLDEQGRRRVPSEFGDFRGHVAYAPGDDLRFLDWRVLARTGDRMLKRFDGVEHRRLSLHVDASASVRVRGRAYLDLIELWLLLGLHTLDSIELVVHGGGGTWQGLERERFEGPADSERVRARVAGLNFDGELDPVQLGDALAQSPGGGAVLLSDFMPGEFWRDVLARASGPGRSLLCVFGRTALERGEASPRELRGMLRLIEAEGGSRVSARGGRKLLRAFAEEQRLWEQEMTGLCRVQRHAFLAADLPNEHARRDVQAWLPFVVQGHGLARGSGRRR